MTKFVTGLTFFVIGVVAVAIGFSRGRRVEPPKADTVYQRVTERSGAVAETVTKTVTFFKTRRDSVRITDTVQVREFLKQLDTVFIRCEQCAEQLRTHKRVSDSIIRVIRDSLAQCQRDKAAAKNERKWWAIGGGALGRLSCGVAR